MNTENEMPRDDKATAEHVKNYLAFLKDDSGDKAKTARRVAMASARLYLSSMALLEQMALLEKPESWAKKIAPLDGQTAEVRAWVKKPKSAEKLEAALASCLKARDKKRKRAEADLSEDPSSVSAQEASASGSEGSSEKKQASKAAKKAKKVEGVQEDEEEEEQEGGQDQESLQVEQHIFPVSGRQRAPPSRR